MDPNAALQDLRDALDECDLDAAASAFSALDEWLQKGGFLPKRWDKNKGDTPHFSARLAELGVKDEFVEWAKTMPDVKTAYAQCRVADWLWFVYEAVGGWTSESRAQHRNLCHAYAVKHRSARDAIHAEYLARRRGADDEFYAVCQTIRAEYIAETGLHDDGWKDRFGAFYKEHESRVRTAEHEHGDRIQALADQEEADYVVAFKSVVPLEVFVKAVG